MKRLSSFWRVGDSALLLVEIVIAPHIHLHVSVTNPGENKASEFLGRHIHDPIECLSSRCCDENASDESDPSSIRVGFHVITGHILDDLDAESVNDDGLQKKVT